MRNNQRGSALLLVILVVAVFLGMLAFSLDRGTTLLRHVHQNSQEDTALYLAEAGLEFAVNKIMSSDTDVSGDDEVAFDSGSFSTSIIQLRSSGFIEIYSRGIATGQGKTEGVQRTLKLVVSHNEQASENSLVMHSREEIF